MNSALEPELDDAWFAPKSEDLVLAPPLIPFPDAALYGLPGRIVRKLQPETESHPAAMLVEVLVQFGSAIGRTAYYEVEDTKHYGNLFAVKVGRSSKARKGTAGSRINKIFSKADPAWSRDCVTSGLSSGEGLIYAVRDEVVDEESGKVLRTGIDDNRLLIREGEFARTLSVNKRDANTLSAVIRDAWDGKEVLKNMTRGRDDANFPLEATGAHISIVGDITSEELAIVISKSDTYNGFANRFLWVYVERSAIKPHGGKALDWKDEVAELKAAIAAAQARKRIYMDENARKMWERVYPRLSRGHDGQFGAVTSRAEAQTIRLALLYALLDKSDYIRTEHLKAALALWGYCEESARHLFKGLTKDQQKIVEALKSGPMSASEIREKTFSRNKTIEEIASDLKQLIELRVVRQDRDKYRLS
jgi:hypothetical protein